MPVWKRLLILPPILIGIALMVLQVQNRSVPQRVDLAERARAVRAIPVPETAVVPRARAYGRVRPARVWSAVAQVAGEVVHRDLRLRDGAILLEGTELVRIDPTDYELAIRQREADILATQAELRTLEVRTENADASLEIEERALRLADEDLTRKRELLQRGNASQATVDMAEITLLNKRQQVQNLRNELALIPAERALTEAKLAQLQVQLEMARLDLARTVITAPFDLLVNDLAIEQAQAVTVGQQLFTGQAIDEAEIEAEAPMEQIRALSAGIGMGLTRERLTRVGSIPIEAIVRFTLGDLTAHWQGRVVRWAADTIDPTARTTGIIVAVDDPLTQAIPGERPPLFNNLYVGVDLRGRPMPDRLVIPRSALHSGNRAYLAGADDRLIIRTVRVGLVQDDFVTVTEGLDPGDRVIVSDLMPASEGMLLSVVVDEALLARLTALAQGLEPSP